jgi:hypothetical protein
MSPIDEPTRAPAENIATWSLSNEHLSLTLSPATQGGLAALVDAKTGRNFIADRSVPLFRLVLSAPGQEAMEVTSLDASNVTVQSSPDQLTLIYGPLRGLDIRVTCRITLEGALSRWRIAVENQTAYGVRAIRYPEVPAPRVLGDSAEDDRFVWGFMGGQMIQNPSRNFRHYAGLAFCRLQHPGVVSVQMQAFYDPTAGLYQATYDATGAIKVFGLMPHEDHFDLTLEHNFDETPGLSFELPYDTILGTFQGDWYTAADLYRAWAVQQHWCAKKTTERDDIPDWLKEPRPWLCVISRGNYERLRGTVWNVPCEWPIAKFWPAKKVVPLMRDYAAHFETPVVTWMEGWEQVGAPAGPVDIFPPYEGAESYMAAMAQLSEDGNLPFAYLAGFHWCYKRPMVGYDGWDRFQREGRPLAALNESGEVDLFQFVNNSKYFVNMCVGSSDVQQLYLDNLMTLMDLGTVALQIDQQIGMYTQVCYSRDHDHSPGYGPWMYQKMLEFLRRTRVAMRRRNPASTFAYEVPCEVWIQEVDLHMHRPYQIRPMGMLAVPLFDYLYHDYALTYGGDTYFGLCHPESDLIKHALVFSYGIQNLIGIGQPEWDYEVNPDYPSLTLMRNIAQAQRTFARPYLVFGQMLRPTPLECKVSDIDLYKHTQFMDDTTDVGTLPVPAVFHSVWRSPTGTTGYVLINWTGSDEPVSLTLLDPSKPARIVSSTSAEAAAQTVGPSGHLNITVPARGIVLVECNG